MPGTSVGPYSVVERLGAGGMGEVYLADDTRLGRRVALKTVSAPSIGSVDARASLLLEACAAAQLNHPNIAAVYDVLDRPDGLHIVMEYVEGQTAAALIRGGRVTVAKAVDVGIQLLEGLEHAHGQGILHRDIKPGNIMITPQGRVKILDFGLAKIADASVHRPSSRDSTEAGVVIGTLAYMAPERLLRKPADQRADLYAAGAVLFEMLTGRLPHVDADSPARAILSMTEAAPAPHTLHPDIPESLSEIVLRALARDPRERYPSAGEFRADLVQVARHLARSDTGPAREEVPPPRPVWFRAGRTMGRLAGATVIVAAVLGWLAWTIASRPAPAEAFGERDWVILADFENRTQEPLFEHAARVALETALQQSRYVNVVPRTQIFEALRRMRVEDTTVVDEARALEIGRRENIKVVLAGSALASGASLQITVRAVDTATGHLLFAETRRFSRKEELFDQVDSLALALRERLGEGVSRADRPRQALARVTTGSLEALQLYSRATDEFARGALEKSRDLLEAALTLDPDFAMAHLRLGAVYASLGQFHRTTSHYERAYALRSHVTEREAYAIQSKYHEVRDEYEKARDGWRILTQIYPDDLTARLELGAALHETGEFEASVPELRHVLALDPFHGSAHARLVLVLARIGRADEAIGAYEQASARGVDNPFLLWGLGLARMARLENDLARDAFTRVQEAGGAYRSLGDLYLAQLESYEGRLTAARSRLQAGLALDQKLANVTNVRLRHYLLGRVLLLQGRHAEAEQQARAIVAPEQPPLIAQHIYQAGTLLVRTDRVDAARQVLQRLERLHEQMRTPFHRTLLETLRGEVALAGGRLKDAEGAFGTAATGYPGSEPHEGLAHVFLRREEWNAAREAWMRVIEMRGNILQVGFAADWPLAHLALARVCGQAGDDPCARRHYESFLKLWQRADPVAALREAEAEYRRLAPR